MKGQQKALKGQQEVAEGRQKVSEQCRRCASRTLVPLVKTRQQDNQVYRCAQCGFIFSPGVAREAPDVPPRESSDEAKPS